MQRNAGDEEKKRMKSKRAMEDRKIEDKQGSEKPPEELFCLCGG